MHIVKLARDRNKGCLAAIAHGRFRREATVPRDAAIRSLSEAERTFVDVPPRPGRLSLTLSGHSAGEEVEIALRAMGACNHAKRGLSRLVHTMRASR